MSCWFDLSHILSMVLELCQERGTYVLPRNHREKYRIVKDTVSAFRYSAEKEKTTENTR